MFTHEAHLRLAWLHIQQYGADKACRTVADLIKNFAFALGAKAKFNMTVTVAAVKTVHHFMQKSTSEYFEEFIAEFPKLRDNFNELLAKHYSRDIHSMAIAKHVYVEPDKLPFR